MTKKTNIIFIVIYTVLGIASFTLFGTEAYNNFITLGLTYAFFTELILNFLIILSFTVLLYCGIIYLHIVLLELFDKKR